MIPANLYEMPQMKAVLIARGDPVAEAYQCPTCPRIESDLVCTDGLPMRLEADGSLTKLHRFICTTCASGPHREALAAQSAVEAEACDPWLSEAGLLIKSQRTQKVNETLWTTAAGSPLTAANREQWEAWRAAMHRLTLDFANPGDVEWPEHPALVYGD